MDESSVKPMTVVIREYSPDMDNPCIYATWRNSSHFSSTVPRGTNESKIFFRAQTQKIKDILRKASVKIACGGDDPTFIVGYSVVTQKHLNWIYVKVDYRNRGIGTMLMPKDIETVTDCLTKIGTIIAKKKGYALAGDL